jgi:hypothetical protein
MRHDPEIRAAESATYMLLVAFMRRNIHGVSHSLVGGLAKTRVAVQGLLLKRE